MTGVSFTIDAMETTNTTGWWSCPDCVIDVELPLVATSGCEVPCPDCGAVMSEQWRWDVMAA